MDLRENFERRAYQDPNSGCWIWEGAESSEGYGRVYARSAGATPQLAHRVAWRLFKGEIPDGMCVLHKCDVRLCVNPDHLYLGTIAQNQRDMARRGRGTKGCLLPFGVSRSRERFVAKVYYADGYHYLGTYATVSEAAKVAAARKAALYKE